MIRRLGIGIVLLVVFAAVFGPWLTPYDPVSQNLPLRLAAPSWSHPLGLDELGRDLLARLLAGARVSLFVGCAVVGSSVVGIGIGRSPVISAARPARDRASHGRPAGVPGILLAIALVAVLGPVPATWFWHSSRLVGSAMPGSCEARC